MAARSSVLTADEARSTVPLLRIVGMKHHGIGHQRERRRCGRRAAIRGWCGTLRWLLLFIQYSPSGWCAGPWDPGKDFRNDHGGTAVRADVGIFRDCRRADARSCSVLATSPPSGDGATSSKARALPRFACRQVLAKQPVVADTVKTGW